MALIRLFDHNTHTTKHLHPGMYNIKQQLAEKRNEQDVPSAFCSHYLREHKARWKWMTFDIHMASAICSQPPLPRA